MPSQLPTSRGADDLRNPVMNPLPNSRILTGTVRHRRSRPKANAFSYGIYHLLVDLAELDELDRTVTGFGHNRWAPIAIHDKDHFGDSDLPLRTKVERWVAGQGRTLPTGALLVTAYPRVFGYVFNPVCWWFAYEPDGSLGMVIAEVRNTFGDWYPYLLDVLDGDGLVVTTPKHAKNFHVSPFLPVEGLDYTFRVRAPHLGAPLGEAVAVHMDVDDEEGRIFDATQAQRTSAFTARNLAWVNVRHPLMTLRTVFLIHAQAVKLFWKRTKFHGRPEAPDAGLDAVTAPDGEAAAHRAV